MISQDLDPAELQALKIHFLIGIVQKEHLRLKNLLGVVQDRHALIHGCRAFLLDGKPVWNGDAAAAKVKNKKHIRMEDEAEARRLVNAQNKLNMTQTRLTNFFSVLTQHCKTLQDFRDVLPDVVITRMGDHEITGIPRTRSPGYPFSPGSNLHKLYHDGLNMIYAYLVNDLVFD